MAAVAALCMEALVSARGAVEREVGALGCCATVSRADGAPSCARTVLSAGRVQSWPVIGLRIHMGKMTVRFTTMKVTGMEYISIAALGRGWRVGMN